MRQLATFGFNAADLQQLLRQHTRTSSVSGFDLRRLLARSADTSGATAAKGSMTIPEFRALVQALAAQHAIPAGSAEALQSRPRRARPTPATPSVAARAR